MFRYLCQYRLPTLGGVTPSRYLYLYLGTCEYWGQAKCVASQFMPPKSKSVCLWGFVAPKPRTACVAREPRNTSVLGSFCVRIRRMGTARWRDGLSRAAQAGPGVSRGNSGLVNGHESGVPPSSMITCFVFFYSF